MRKGERKELRQSTCWRVKVYPSESNTIQHNPSEPFGSQPYHYGNSDDDDDLATTGAFTEKSIRAGTRTQL